MPTHKYKITSFMTTTDPGAPRIEVSYTEISTGILTRILLPRGTQKKMANIRSALAMLLKSKEEYFVWDLNLNR